MNPDAVLKVGGSLNRGAGLAALCREIARLSKNFRLLIVPGGGEFADRVREAYRRYNLDETAAHCMALLAMDQYGYLLGSLIEGSSLTADLLSACRASESGRAAVLLPSALIIRTDSLPHSWQVTSDAIAAWVAREAQSSRLILLKDVDGLLTAAPGTDSAELIEELTIEQLTEHAGGVDEYLSNILSHSQLETWVINGLRPERLPELLVTSRTIGTKIRCAYVS